MVDILKKIEDPNLGKNSEF